MVTNDHRRPSNSPAPRTRVPQLMEAFTRLAVVALALPAGPGHVPPAKAERETLRITETSPAGAGR
jgi:hypothetical protein